MAGESWLCVSTLRGRYLHRAEMRDLRANFLVLGLVRLISSGSGSSEGVGYSLAVSGRCRLCRLQLLPRHDNGLMHIVAVLPATAPQTRMHLQHE